MMSECQRFLYPGLVNGGDTILERGLEHRLADGLDCLLA